MASTALYLLLAFVAPLPLIVIETLFPYPFLVEELVKFGLVWGILRTRACGMQQQRIAVVLMGAFFALSETMFYVANYFFIGNFYAFLPRLLLTGSMHILTCVVLFLFGRKGRYWQWLGLAVAILLHYIFNRLVS